MFVVVSGVLCRSKLALQSLLLRPITGITEMTKQAYNDRKKTTHKM